MYFENNCTGEYPVYYAHRSLDTQGVYMTLQRYQDLFVGCRSEWDSIGELATETHVTNIFVEQSMLKRVLAQYAWLEPTHVRLSAEYANV